ncbi:MAG: ATP-binding protein [Candidatus Margulisbacteria bacterium]|jgi:signal transduction histidine kinase|nr:ATP-binding protein [Candidatus Margulisiibacteriota bacterium]
MLSNLTIISIFTEIFTAGILISGSLTFARSFLLSRRYKDLCFSLVLWFLFQYVALGIFSQLMYDLGWKVPQLIPIQRWGYTSLALCAFSLWLFITEKFTLRWGHLISLLLLFFTGGLIFQIFDSTVSLVYREDVIEPLVYFSSLISVKPLFALVWVVFAVSAFWTAARSSGGRRVLSLYSGLSALLILLTFPLSVAYGQFGDAGYLLAFWLATLIASLGLILAELIPPEAPEAVAPLRFLRTRLLFKLMLIFVLLIVILFEATTVATINISKSALSKSIQAAYLKSASDVAAQISASDEPPDSEALHKILAQSAPPALAETFIVDNKGTVIAHPDRRIALQRQPMLANEAVGLLLAGRQGVAEFRNELGAKVVGAYVPVKKYGWGVVVQQPIENAYFEMRRLETNSLLFVVAGILLTALTGIFFARSIERPIMALIRGTEAISRGELGYKISVDSQDEIGKLATAFNLMTRDLRDSQERLILSEKLASLGTMAAGMAHEIKNPLVSLRTFTQLLQQKWDDKEFREKFSAIIPTEIERINRIAESLLKFGRPMKPELTRVDVNTLLEEVLLLFESEAKKNNVNVTKKLAKVPEVSGDAGQLSQAFVNIIKNAIEAMQSKGGELTVKTDVGEVIRLGKISGRQGVQKGDEVVWGEEEELGKPIPVVFIEVTDSGEGISEQNLKSLFDPFFTTKMTGTGMGLPITLRIIEEHKGSVKVRSRAGKGTTFIITLPQKA